MKHLVLLVIIGLQFHSSGQTKNLYGKIIDSKSNQPICCVKVLVKSNNGKTIAGTYVDLEGMYQLKNVSFSVDTVQLFIEAKCFYPDRILKLSLLNDSTLTDYKLTAFDCMDFVEQQCKYKSDSCNVYKIEPLIDHSRGKEKGTVNVCEPPKEYMTAESYADGCCLKTRYCKTHNYQY